MKPLLLLVDLQNDFLGAADLEPPPAEIVRRASRLLSGARALSVPVVHVRTEVDPGGSDRMPHWKALGRWACVRGTPGQASPVQLEPEGGEAVVSKTFFSAFSTADLEPILAAAAPDTVVVAGVHLHGCVRATVLDAYQRGLTVWVADDAVGSDDPLHAAVTRRYLDQRAARFASVEDILELLSGADARRAAARELPAAVVAGRELPADGRARLLHRSPRETAAPIFAVPLAGPGEARAAAAASREALGGWWKVTAAERTRLLFDMAERVETEAGELARDMAIELGKPVSAGEAEARRAAALVRSAPSAGGAVPCGADSSMRRVPLGVVAIVTPWNNPAAIPLGKIAPAISLGNAVLWKPAPAATPVALRLLELARQAGLPDGLINLVSGDHRTARAVMSDSGVDAVSISGSSAAGWTAQEICSRRRVPLQAELGGNNAAIVWRGGDLERAARQIARGAMSFAGQRCTANRRAVVDARIFEDFLALVVREVESLRWGDPLDPSIDVGPLVSTDARDRIAQAVERASSGAERVLSPHGNGPLAGDLRARGAYYPPTVIADADRASEVVQEETFGPILVVQRAGDFEEALALGNGVRQGLVAALFSGDGGLRERFLEAAQAGVLKWNAATADADAVAPFGGWKASGVGPPEHGAGDLEFFTRIQAIYGGR